MTYDVIRKAAEFSDVLEAHYFEPTGKYRRADVLSKAIDFLHEEIDETQAAIYDSDTAEIIDGFGDVAFVALNGIYKDFRMRGRSHTEATDATVEVMRRICEANLAKLQPDGTVLRINGKVQKPEGWKAPSYEDMVA